MTQVSPVTEKYLVICSPPWEKTTERSFRTLAEATAWLAKNPWEYERNLYHVDIYEIAAQVDVKAAMKAHAEAQTKTTAG